MFPFPLYFQVSELASIEKIFRLDEDVKYSMISLHSFKLIFLRDFV